MRAPEAPLILVVDDDYDIREVIADVLTHGGYRVSAASNGKVALEETRANRPDLIVLDLMMPVMNGWQFMEARRADPGIAGIPVVVITAFRNAHVEGAAELIQKPFDFETLLTAAARLCGGRKRPGHLTA
jgi:CheY-like chemotaxis protein